MKRRTILITGGAGFIGSHTADAFAKKGYRVRILDNLSPLIHQNRWPNYVKNKSYELIKGDVREKNDLLRALRGVSFVFHLAAHQDQRPDFSLFFDVNTRGTALLYELIAAKNFPVKKIVVASSQFVYGDGKYRCAHSGKFFYPELRSREAFTRKQFDILCSHGSRARFYPFREDQPLAPTNAYGLSKQALENLALRFGKTHKIPTTVLRYSVVQGARQSPRNLYSGALRIFVTQALRGKPITVYEDGNQLRDFVHINDVVAANLTAFSKKATNYEIFNVGGGKAYRVIDFAHLVKKITASRSEIKIGGFRSTDTRHAASDISKLKHLGWRPRLAPEKSIQDYIDWLKREAKSFQ